MTVKVFLLVKAIDEKFVVIKAYFQTLCLASIFIILFSIPKIRLHLGHIFTFFWLFKYENIYFYCKYQRLCLNIKFLFLNYVERVLYIHYSENYSIIINRFFCSSFFIKFFDFCDL